MSEVPTPRRSSKLVSVIRRLIMRADRSSCMAGMIPAITLDDLGLDDDVVYKPEVMPTGGSSTSGRAVAMPRSAKDAAPALGALLPYRHHPQSPSRALPRSQWGLQFTVLRETQLRACTYLFICLLCRFYARFCRLSCEIRRDLGEVARASHNQLFLNPACAVISFRIAI
jgi:hypothetical protein